MMIVAKMEDGRIVQIIRTQESVQFSPEKGWIFVCYDFDKINRRYQVCLDQGVLRCIDTHRARNC